MKHLKTTVIRLLCVSLGIAFVLIGVTPSALAATYTPASPTVIFSEDFENADTSTSIMPLTSYVGISGMTYGADDNWANPDSCNGLVLTILTPHIPTSTCGGTGNTSFDSVKALAQVLGKINSSSNPDNNHAIAALTGSPQPSASNLREFYTKSPVSVKVNNRFITFSVNAAATSCGYAHPLLRFYYTNGGSGTENPISTSPIDPCTSPGTQSYGVDQFGGIFAANAPILYTGTELGITMRDETPVPAAGNDGAFDDIKILDVTPKLYQSMPAGTFVYGDDIPLTLTVTNTSELAQKTGWSLTDKLPSGLRISTTPAATTTCSGTTLTANAGGQAISLSGNLKTGQSDCSATVNVVALKGTALYTSFPGNFILTGLLAPNFLGLSATDKDTLTASYIAPPPADPASDGRTKSTIKTPATSYGQSSSSQISLIVFIIIGAIMSSGSGLALLLHRGKH